jgi:hypothetical protein
MPKQTEPPAIVRISTNTIINGKFYKRGEPLPFTKAEDLPPNLRPLVVTNEPEEAEEPNEPTGAFQLNTLYQVTSEGRLGRRVQREIQRMEDDEARDEWIEEQMDAPLPPAVAESLQADHERDIEMQRAQAQVDARRSDEASDAAAAAGAVPTLYVRRGSRHYAPALNARLKAGESVFVRKPEGRFEYVGIVNGDGELPDLPIQL